MFVQENTQPDVKKKEYCDLCRCKMLASHSAEHLAGKKHQNNVFIYQQLINRSIRVSNIPQQAPPPLLLQYFQNYGQVEDMKYQGGSKPSVIITFVDRRVQSNVLRCNHYIYGHKILVSPHRFPQNFTPICETPQDRKMKFFNSLHKKFIDAAVKAENISMQMAMFMEMFGEPVQSKQMKHRICQEIHSTLKNHFPKCTLHAFGSTVNKCGFYQCDLDLFIDLGFPVKKSVPKTNKDKHENKRQKINSYKDYFSLTYEEITELDDLELLKMMFKILRPWLRTVSNHPVVIAKCQVPLIKFVHQPSEISCDINIKNGFGVKNSRLIFLYTELDPRVRPLIMNFRYWLKLKKFDIYVSNYAISMLVIFFLQIIDVPVVPRIIDIVTHQDIDDSNEQGKEDFKDISKMPKSENNCSQGDLLIQLFHFYGNFDFSKLVVCLRDATLLYKNQFEVNGQKLNFFTDKAMCVQDPFELNRNITSNLSISNLKKIQFNMNLSCPQFTSTDEHGLWGLSNVFSSPAVALEASEVSENYFTIRKFKKFENINSCEWQAKICNLTLYILKAVLLFECEVLIDYENQAGGKEASSKDDVTDDVECEPTKDESTAVGTNDGKVLGNKNRKEEVELETEVPSANANKEHIDEQLVRNVHNVDISESTVSSTTEKKEHVDENQLTCNVDGNYAPDEIQQSEAVMEDALEDGSNAPDEIQQSEAVTLFNADNIEACHSHLMEETICVSETNEDDEMSDDEPIEEHVQENGEENATVEQGTNSEDGIFCVRFQTHYNTWDDRKNKRRSGKGKSDNFVDTCIKKSEALKSKRKASEKPLVDLKLLIKANSTHADKVQVIIKPTDNDPDSSKSKNAFRLTEFLKSFIPSVISEKLAD